MRTVRNMCGATLAATAICFAACGTEPAAKRESNEVAVDADAAVEAETPAATPKPDDLPVSPATRVETEAPTPGPTLLVKGGLRDSGGEPVKGTDCTFHKAKGSGYTIETDERGVIKNPTATTDDQGRFAFKVPRSFLPDDRQITITCNVGGWATQLTDSHGAALILQVDPDSEVLDLERAVGIITVK